LCEREIWRQTPAGISSLRYTLAMFDIIQYTEGFVIVELFEVFPFRLAPPSFVSSTPASLGRDRYAANASKENGISRSFLSAVQLAKLLFVVTA
jgi:hypothetical protein